MPRKRIRRTPAQVRSILAEFHDSGQSQAEYCRENGYRSGTFSRWLRQHGKTGRASELPLIPVKLSATSISLPTMVEIRLPSGRELRVPESIQPASLAKIVEVLERC